MATNKTVFFLIGILLIVLGVSMLAPYSMQIIFKVRNYGQTFYKEIGAGEEPLFSPEDAGI